MHSPSNSHATIDVPGITLLHVDDALIAVDKPSGMLAVPGRGADKQDCAWHRVRAAYPDALVVHRLDEATSGLMLLARGPAMQRHLSRAFERREVEKRYLAVVSGLPVADAGEIDLPLAADWPQRPRQRVDVATGKPSLTRWRVLTRDVATDTALLELIPLTGRTHQLRVHCAAIGHPIVGDRLYAPPPIAALAPRLLLHASALRLCHPDGDGERMFVLLSAAPFSTDGMPCDAPQDPALRRPDAPQRLATEADHPCILEPRVAKYVI